MTDAQFIEKTVTDAKNRLAVMTPADRARVLASLADEFMSTYYADSFADAVVFVAKLPAPQFAQITNEYTVNERFQYVVRFAL